MRRRCPDCCVRLVFQWIHYTDWYGVLRYWRCTNCRERFVTRNHGSAEVAA